MPSLADILRINPLGERYCIAYSFSPQLVCHSHIRATNLIGLLLEEGNRRLEQGHTIQPVLRQLAPLLLCRVHQFLRSEYIAAWMGEVCEFQEEQREREIEREMERQRERQRHGEVQPWPLPRLSASLTPSPSSSSATLPPHSASASTTVTLGYQSLSTRSLSGYSTSTSTTASIPNYPPPTTSTSIPPLPPNQTDEMSLLPSARTGVYATRQEDDIHAPARNPFAPIHQQPPGMVTTHIGFSSLPSPTDPPRISATTVHTTSLLSEKSRKSVARRAIEGECGICILPFSVDPDDGSFVGCVTRDGAESDADVFSSDEDDGDEGDAMLVDGLTDHEDCDEEDEDEENEDDTEDQSDDEANDDDNDHDEDDIKGAKEKDPIVWCKVQCGTNYHRSCLETWIATFRNEVYRRPTCPTCRAPWKD